jgi:hypothetical protein
MRRVSGTTTSNEQAGVTRDVTRMPLPGSRWRRNNEDLRILAPAWLRRLSSMRLPIQHASWAVLLSPGRQLIPAAGVFRLRRRCQNAAMECYRRAMIGEQTFEGRRENLAQANKLSRTYAALLEALTRHRGKGQQNIHVDKAL